MEDSHKAYSKKDITIVLCIILSCVVFVILFALLYSCNTNKGNKENDGTRKTISMQGIPAEWEYFAPAIELHKKDGTDFSWEQIGFVQAYFHIEIGSQKVKPMFLVESGMYDYTRDDAIFAFVDYSYTPQGGYRIESMECDTFASFKVFYNAQNLRNITTDNFDIVLEKISIRYVDYYLNEHSVSYTGSQIMENFDFEIYMCGYNVSDGKKISDTKKSNIK